MASDFMKPSPISQRIWDRLSDANKQLVHRGWHEENGWQQDCLAECLLNTRCITETIQ